VVVRQPLKILQLRNQHLRDVAEQPSLLPRRNPHQLPNDVAVLLPRRLLKMLQLSLLQRRSAE
jgi:hypothetical protein